MACRAALPTTVGQPGSDAVGALPDLAGIQRDQARLTKAGFTELQRLRQQPLDRPDRKYAAIAAAATAS
ncbi:hypothetical protein GCM10010201_36620 [Pilimelia columellifera subsp. columellifera]|uniref:Uncharacterized protein n=1 Tax=Pilimelia columellifera subsp. columellifera TaxID=706583 RepID=A0ABN3NSZ4_9ACTN